MIFALVLTAATAAPAVPPCSADECLRRLNVLTAVVEVSVSDASLSGRYAGGDRLLSGRDLYLFDDRTFIYSEWADVLRETIFDMGTWALEGRVLVFKSDSGVTWRRRIRFDHRAMAIRVAGGEPDFILIGVDQELALIERALKETDPGTPEDYLRVFGFKRKSSWTPTEASEVKARLLKDAWRPEFFRQ
jgi:hypothetical protein